MMEMLEHTYCGFRIVENPWIPEFSPTISLRDNVTCTDEFRSNFNAWLLELFGRQRNIYFIDNTIVLHPNNKNYLAAKLNPNYLQLRMKPAKENKE